MADEESRPDFGISGPSPADDAWRLRKQAAISALDEVLKAIDKDLVLPALQESGLDWSTEATSL